MTAPIVFHGRVSTLSVFSTPTSVIITDERHWQSVTMTSEEAFKLRDVLLSAFHHIPVPAPAPATEGGTP